MASKLFAARKSSWTTLHDLIQSGHEFHNNGKTFRGVRWDAEHATLPGRGMMPEGDWNTLKRIHDQYGINYVVYSYHTVIAYRDTHGEWHHPKVTYSRTTTQHQNRIRVATNDFGKVSV